jgi:hypothetical protein
MMTSTGNPKTSSDFYKKRCLTAEKNADSSFTAAKNLDHKVIFKDSARTAQYTHFSSITKTKHLMLFTDKITVCSQNEVG